MVTSSVDLQEVRQDHVENSPSIIRSFNKLLLADYVSKAVLYDRGTGHVINNSQISKEIDSVQAFAKSMCRSASQTVSAGGIRLSCHREGKTVPDGVIYS